MRFGIYWYALNVDTKSIKAFIDYCIGEWDPSAKEYQGLSTDEAAKKRICQELGKKGLLNWDNVVDFHAIVIDFKATNRVKGFDKLVHKILKRYHITGEWFRLDSKDIERAIICAAKEERFFKSNLNKYNPNSLQQKAINKLTKAINQKLACRKILVDVPTGGGKTFIDLLAFLNSNASTAIMVSWMPNVLYEWIAEGEDHILLAGKILITDDIDEFLESDCPKKLFIVSAYRIMENNNWEDYKALEDITFDLKLLDEAHRGAHNDWSNIKLKIHYYTEIHITATGFPNRRKHNFNEIVQITLEQIYNKKKEVIELKKNQQALAVPEDEYFVDVPILELCIREPSEITKEKAKEAGLNEWDAGHFHLQDGLDDARIEYWQNMFPPSTKNLGLIRRLNPNGKFPLSAFLPGQHIIVVTKTVKGCNNIETAMAHSGMFKGWKINQIHDYKTDLDKVRTDVENNDRTVSISCGSGLTGTNVKQWNKIIFEYDPKSVIEILQYAGRIIRRNGKEKGEQGVQAWFSSINSVLILIYEDAKRRSDGSQKGLEKAVQEFLNIILCTIYDADGTPRKMDPAELIEKCERAFKDSVENGKRTDDYVDSDIYDFLSLKEPPAVKEVSKKKGEKVSVAKDDYYVQAKSTAPKQFNNGTKGSDSNKTAKNIGARILMFIQLLKERNMLGDTFEDSVKNNFELFAELTKIPTVALFEKALNAGKFNINLLEKTMIVCDEVPGAYEGSYQAVPMALIPEFKRLGTKSKTGCVVGGSVNLIDVLDCETKYYIAFSKEEQAVIRFRRPEVEKVFNWWEDQEEISKMKFGTIIGNPPFSGGDKIASTCFKLSDNLILLLPPDWWKNPDAENKYGDLCKSLWKLVPMTDIEFRKAFGRRMELPTSIFCFKRGTTNCIRSPNHNLKKPKISLADLKTTYSGQKAFLALRTLGNANESPVSFGIFDGKPFKLFESNQIFDGDTPLDALNRRRKRAGKKEAINETAIVGIPCKSKKQILELRDYILSQQELLTRVHLHHSWKLQWVNGIDFA